MKAVIKKNYAIELICYAIILLFVYAALSKVFIFPIFVEDLKRSPLISKFSGILSVLLPLLELGISAMVFFERTRLQGLWGAFILMIIFTCYVGFIVFTDDSPPCSCGGLIRNLTWKNHLILNVMYTLMALTGIIIQRRIQWNWSKT